MTDALFLDSATLGEVVTYVGTFVAFGVGLAIVFWLLGLGVWFVIDLLRGGF